MSGIAQKHCTWFSRATKDFGIYQQKQLKSTVFCSVAQGKLTSSSSRFAIKWQMQPSRLIMQIDMCHCFFLLGLCQNIHQEKKGF
jgi:hypothetical protein